MGDYCYDSQLNSIDGELYNIREELKIVNQNLEEILGLFRDFEKMVGEPSFLSVPIKSDKDPKAD